MMKMNFASEQDFLSPRPIDWGIGFFRQFRSQLLQLALPVIVIRLLLLLVLQQSTPSLQIYFLLGLCEGMLRALLFSAAGMFVFTAFKNKKRIIPAQIMQQAFASLPKIIFSFFLVAVLVFFLLQAVVGGVSSAIFSGANLGLGLVPLLALVVMPVFFCGVFFWAPAFVVGETFCKVKPREGDDDDYYEPDEEEKKITYFEGQHVWDIGFMRSSWFAFFRPSLTAQILLLFWVSVAVPRALVSFIEMGDLTGYLSVVVETVFDLWFFVVFFGAFIAGMPLRFLRETDIRWNEPAVKIDNVNLGRLQGSVLKLVLLFLVALVSTAVSFAGAMRQQHVPKTAKFTLVGTELAGGYLNMKIDIEDKEAGLSWLGDPSKFVLSDSEKSDEVRGLIAEKILRRGLGEEVKQKSSIANESDAAAKKEDLVKPSEVGEKQELPLLADKARRKLILEPRSGRMLDAKGEVIPLQLTALQEKQVSVVLSFRIKDEVASAASMNLFYFTGLGINGPLLKIDLPQVEVTAE
ncbi:MAG: hypothetical protein PHC51_13635 [bacterium]|nr:hypothetical protein [bacterium]